MNSEGDTCFLGHFMAGVPQKCLAYVKQGLWFRLWELKMLRLHPGVIAGHCTKPWDEVPGGRS